MLSILFGEQFDIFRQILHFYKPNGGNVLDLTYGKGTLWKSKAVEEYNVVSIDIDLKTRPTYHADFRKLPSQISSEQYDIIVYDPPYKYISKRFILQNRKAKLWRDEERTKCLSIEDQRENAQILNATLPSILKDDGILIIKIMDVRFEKNLVLNHVMMIEEFSNFYLKDLLVYIKLGVGIFVNKVSAQTAHGFFLIFKKVLK